MPTNNNGGWQAAMKSWVVRNSKDKKNPNTTYDNYNELKDGYAAYRKDPTAAQTLKAQNDANYQMAQELGVPTWLGHDPTPQALQQAYGAASGGSYGGGGGGGGGGLSASQQLAEQRRREAMAALDALAAKLPGAVSADRAAAANAYGQLDQYLAGLSNPYANAQMPSATQVDPTALANLLQSQGADSAGLRAQAQYLQAQNAQSQQAAARQAQLLAAAQDAWNQSARTGGKQAAAQADAELAAQLLQLQSALAMRKAGL